MSGFCDEAATRMPTLYKAQLSETETPWRRIYGQMYVGLRPRARQILQLAGFYRELDLEMPPAERRLSRDEKLEFEAVVAAVTKAAVQCQLMSPGVMVATLRKISKSPPERLDKLPAIIQWVLAAFYRRGQESAGTYALDIWGTETTSANYIRGEPTTENVARAAQAALHELSRSSGRPHHPANLLLARELAPVFRRYGGTTSRQSRKDIRTKGGEAFVKYIEDGPYYEWLSLVLPPLATFLQERRLPPVTIESVVRLSARPHPLPTHRAA